MNKLYDVKAGDRVRVYSSDDDCQTHCFAVVKHVTSTGWITAEVDHPGHKHHGKVLTVHPDLYEKAKVKNGKAEKNKPGD